MYRLRSHPQSLMSAALLDSDDFDYCFRYWCWRLLFCFRVSSGKSTQHKLRIQVSLLKPNQSKILPIVHLCVLVQFSKVSQCCLLIYLVIFSMGLRGRCAEWVLVLLLFHFSTLGGGNGKGLEERVSNWVFTSSDFTAGHPHPFICVCFIDHFWRGRGGQEVLCKELMQKFQPFKLKWVVPRDSRVRDNGSGMGGSSCSPLVWFLHGCPEWDHVIPNGVYEIFWAERQVAFPQVLCVPELKSIK